LERRSIAIPLLIVAVLLVTIPLLTVAVLLVAIPLLTVAVLLVVIPLLTVDILHFRLLMFIEINCTFDRSAAFFAEMSACLDLVPTIFTLHMCTPFIIMVIIYYHKPAIMSRLHEIFF
jgi:hypothetical protein